MAIPSKAIFRDSFLIVLSGLIGGVAGAWFTAYASKPTTYNFVLLLAGLIILVGLTLIAMIAWRRLCDTKQKKE